MAGKTGRVERGRFHSYRLDGQRCDGVTWAIDNGVPKRALIAWAAREAAEYAVDNLDLIGRLDRDAAVDLVKGSPWRDRDRAAKRGTEVHGYAEKLARGETVEVPEELVGHVDSYLAFRDEWNPTDELIELVVFNRTVRYGGTLDLIATLDELGRTLVDLKTNRSGPFGEVGLQCAAYRYCEFYLDPDTGKEMPMPEVDSVACLWLRADGYDLLPVQAGPREFRQWRYAQQIAHFCEEQSKQIIGDALIPPTAAGAA